MFLKKRGQTTLFIIIGIVILVVVGILFYFRSSLGVEGGEVSFSSKVDEIKSYTQDCIDNTVKNGLVEINSKAGYYGNIPDSYEGYVYLYNAPNDYTLSDAEVEENIKSYVENNLDECIDEYSIFKGGYDIKSGDPVVSVEIGELTNVNVKYPVIIRKGNEKAELFDDFKIVSVNDGMKKSLQEARVAVDNFIQNDYICVADQNVGGGLNVDDVDLCSWLNVDDDIEYRFMFVLGEI